jgi:hypothetical protein
MSEPNQIIQIYSETYSEWKETLGADFPQFLVFKLASDLAKEKDLNEYLRRLLHATTN